MTAHVGHIFIFSCLSYIFFFVCRNTGTFMLHWLHVIFLVRLLFCTKGSSVKRPTHLQLPKSSQHLIFLSEAFIFLPRTVSAFLLFMRIQIAEPGKTSLIYSTDDDESDLFDALRQSVIGSDRANFLDCFLENRRRCRFRKSLGLKSKSTKKHSDNFFVNHIRLIFSFPGFDLENF